MQIVPTDKHTDQCPCKGCSEGLERQGDIHVDAEGYPAQVCTKKKAENPVQDYLDAMGEVYMDEMGRLFD